MNRESKLTWKDQLATQINGKYSVNSETKSKFLHFTRHTGLLAASPDSLSLVLSCAPGILIRAPNKTSARESAHTGHRTRQARESLGTRLHGIAADL